METTTHSNTSFSPSHSLLPFSPTSLKLLVGSGIVALSLSMTACSDADAINDQANATEVEETVFAIPVETQTIVTGDITSTYDTTAILEAREEAFVVARASGIIEEIFVEEGDYVEKGQVLAQLDKRRYELNLS